MLRVKSCHEWFLVAGTTCHDLCFWGYGSKAGTTWRTHSDSLRMAVSLEVQDLECSVCCSVLRDPFVTSCGHSFCHECLSQHQAVKCTCPQCGTYLSPDQTFPNFLLSRVSCRAS